MIVAASLTFLLDSPTDTLPANTHRDTFSDRDVDTIQDFSHTFYTVTDFNYAAFFPFFFFFCFWPTLFDGNFYLLSKFSLENIRLPSCASFSFFLPPRKFLFYSSRSLDICVCLRTIKE